MDGLEDGIGFLKTEYVVMKQKWFVGEQIDPVFEGTVKDFCEFDATLQDLYKNIEVFMKSVDGMCVGTMKI